MKALLFGLRETQTLLYNNTYIHTQLNVLVWYWIVRMIVCMYVCMYMYIRTYIKVSIYIPVYGVLRRTNDCSNFILLHVWMCMYGTFFFDAPHELLGLLILRCHDVTHTQVGQHNHSDVQQSILQPFYLKEENWYGSEIPRMYICMYICIYVWIHAYTLILLCILSL
jgi:hypothetical protein